MLGSGRECALLAQPRVGARGWHLHCYNDAISPVLEDETGPATYWPDNAGMIALDGSAAIRFGTVDISPFAGVAGTSTPYKIILYDNGLNPCEGYLAEADAVYSQISRTTTLDSGSDLPNVGEVLTGATSEAVGTVLTVNDTGGDWGAGTGTGNVTMGTCDGRFQDNENLNGSVSGANCCTLNMPDSAAGVDLLQNGDFSVDTDPPPGWAAGNSTLTTEAAGKVGNCLKVLAVATPGYANKTFTVEAGKTYRWEFYYKVTAPDIAQIRVRDITNSTDMTSQTDMPDTAGAWSAKQTHTFIAPAGCTAVRLYCYSKFNTDITYWDEMACYEIAELGTDGCDVVSAKDGSTQNWESQHASFDYNDPDGYTFEIFSTSLMVPTFGTTYAQLAADDEVVVYSSSANDITQNVTVFGIDSNGKKAKESIAVAGVAKVSGLITFSYIENIWMDIEATTGIITLARDNSATYTYIMEIEVAAINSGIAQHFNGECECYVTSFAAGLYDGTKDATYELRWYPDDDASRGTGGTTGYEVLDELYCPVEDGKDNHPYPTPIGPLPPGGWLVVYATADAPAAKGWCSVQGFDVEI